MVFYLYAKDYKRWLNGSKDTANTKIEQSYWLRGFEPKSREPEFSRTWGLHRKLDNNKMLHFWPFIAKTNYSNLRKSSKTLILGTFGQIWAEREFSRKIRLCYFSSSLNL